MHIPTQRTGHDITALRAVIGGTVATPTDPEWETARLAWNLAVDQHPVAVVTAADVHDVVATVRHARRHGLTVAAQPTGHGATAEISGTVLLRTGRLNELVVDAERRTARVGAGVRVRDLLAATAPHGLAPLPGSNGDPSVVGYTLGGGLSWFSRAYGWHADRVTAVELVDPDGRFVRVDAESDPELFWAVRGGGGDFGIVTAIEIDLVEVPHVFGGRLMWPVEAAPQVLRTFREVTATAPEEMSTWAWILHLPALPFLPEFLQGKSFVVIDLTVLGSVEHGAALAAPLRAAGGAVAPVLDTLGTVPIEDIPLIAAEPDDPTPAMEYATTLTDLDDATIDALLEQVADRGRAALTAVEIRHIGGAISRPRAGRGAVPEIAEPYLLLGLGFVMAPELVPAITTALAALGGLDAATGKAYFSFLADGETVDKAFPPATLARLQDIKRRRDPYGVIGSNRPVLAAAETDVLVAG